ncbi:TPA: lipoyl(octanoyl) transferase LipB [Enterobacter hormaechei subsp. steigerwaltii]|uniref:lipoyl(octanoyl) transferase LipB n=1 Tax=Enterobacter hormaechei TaxID=158836 RepID=UPI001142D4C3|nr:lipoyl(octanoyl) transferase LipB [Enterobacter hormaechei]HAV1456065.1 lipoyl(octanoyl) transferase LipB [Enterobacter hormaechei subsp. steigerwaltii]HCJ7665625.1 lipoyl(octanoyl) transferase LipB [Enterobacter hormaechei subsp. xiangfangensis]ELC6547499.1 lipoyl(octanoyl) transferase LipB [Enterobacter hormaechei]TQD18013.1 lipoyl(octanoyl) transferase LipB [Enterobacter hormaechei]HAV1836022.1 lipoyl(octanoyl) transferase LipB [Enterobacter hormaechei subsp. steigerwaltii]
MYQDKILVRHLGLQPYEPVSQAMHEFTDMRDDTTPDEIWLVEHLPVFTQGQAGKAEHLLMTGDIPVIQSDRGGQVTYHGPGQQVMYVLLNLKRRKLGVRELVTLLEQTVVNTLAEYGIDAHPRADAPGVYVGEMKICSLGLRIRKGCSFHGLALNINMDLTPFQRINPCGYAGMEMTQMRQWVDTATPENIRPVLLKEFLALLNNPDYEYIAA